MSSFMQVLPSMEAGDAYDNLEVIAKRGGLFYVRENGQHLLVKFAPNDSVFEFKLGNCVGAKIAPVIGHYSDGEKTAIVMPGYALKSRGRPDLNAVATNIAKALEYLESRNIVHGRIEPDRLVYSRADPTDPYLINFDFAVESKLHRCTNTFGDSTRGLRASTASDVQSLGGCIYELATGISPKDFPIDWLPALIGPIPSRIDTGVFNPLDDQFGKRVKLPPIEEVIPGPLGPLVRKMLDYEPDKRPTPKQILEYLEANGIAHK